MSHYDYLDLVIEHFWVSVFGKTLEETWCAGIIASHGDKCYSYREEWHTAGIAFNRGALLYLLTYTPMLGDTPKFESCEWVIANYPKFLDKVIAAEKKVGVNGTEIGEPK